MILHKNNKSLKTTAEIYQEETGAVYLILGGELGLKTPLTLNQIQEANIKVCNLEGFNQEAFWRFYNFTLKGSSPI